MRIIGMGVLISLLCGMASGQTARKEPPPVAPFVGGEREASTLRSTVKILVNPDNPGFGSGVIVTLDRERYPKLLRDGEVAVLTAAHVADGLHWDRELDVQCIDFINRNGQRMITFSESFPARVVMLPLDHNADVSLLAASIPRERFEKGLAKEVTCATGEYPFQLNEELLVIGCAGGQLPTYKKTWVGNKDGSVERPYIHVSEWCQVGESGGPAFNAEGKVVALCSATMGEPENIAFGWGLHGKPAEQARAVAQVVKRRWGIYATFPHLDALLQQGNREADALNQLERALAEFQKVRQER